MNADYCDEKSMMSWVEIGRIRPVDIFYAAYFLRYS